MSTPDMKAETLLGATGCAAGSQMWNGTMPALMPKPTRNSRKAASRLPGDICAPMLCRLAKLKSPDAWNSSAKPRMMHPASRCDMMK